MKILILTSKFGMGHYQAAKAIQEMLTKSLDSKDATIGSKDLTNQGARKNARINSIEDTTKNTIENTTENTVIDNSQDTIEIIDIYEYAFPDSHKFLYKLYGSFVDKGNKLYNLAYKKATTNHQENQSTSLFLHQLLHSVTQLLIAKQSDVIISTYSICGELVANYKEKYNPQVTTITAITDVKPHLTWVNSNTNYYLAANDQTKAELIQMGAAEESIKICGIPVSSEFVEAKQSRELGKVHPNKKSRSVKNPQKQILIMGGGLGLIPTDMRFYHRLDKARGIQTTVVCGKNKKLFKKLYGKFSNIRVLGYTTKVPMLMKEADLLISKAGGITTYEAIYSHTPIAVFKPFLEQEISNCQFIQSSGIGMVLQNKMEQAGREIGDILDLVQDDQRLGEMKVQMDQVLSQVVPDEICRIMEQVKQSKAVNSTLQNHIIDNTEDAAADNNIIGNNITDNNIIEGSAADNNIQKNNFTEVA